MLGADLRQDALVLGRLRRLERLARLALEQRRRIAHRRVEPQAIEAVAEIVVGVDVALRTLARIVPPAMQELQGEIVQRVGATHAAQHLLVLGQQRDQPRQIGRIAVAVHVGFGEAHVAVEQDPAKEAPVLDLQLDLRFGVGRTKGASRTVRQSQRQPAESKALERLEHEMGGKGGQRDTNSGGGAGLW